MFELVFPFMAGSSEGSGTSSGPVTYRPISVTSNIGWLPGVGSTMVSALNASGGTLANPTQRMACVVLRLG